MSPSAVDFFSSQCSNRKRHSPKSPQLQLQYYFQLHAVRIYLFYLQPQSRRALARSRSNIYPISPTRMRIKGRYITVQRIIIRLRQLSSLSTSRPGHKFAFHCQLEAVYVVCNQADHKNRSCRQVRYFPFHFSDFQELDCAVHS
jgi:hypothetical protein